MKDKPTEKLQKILANAGYGSRREIEKWIEEGRVQLNGKKATLGDRATSDDRIKLDGKLLKRQFAVEEDRRIILYHKPVGEICSRHDPEGRPTVFDHLPKLKKGKWISIGRLDLNTCGLLLFTNDGEFANQMTHPSTEIERKYAVRVLGELNPEQIEKLERGVRLEDGMAHFKQIRHSSGDGANQWYHVTLCEGRHREVRRLFESQGVKVNRLIRIAFGRFRLPRELKPGDWMEVL